MSDLAAPEHYILVVEDDPATRDALTTLLELEGHEVLAAANGLEALDRLRAGGRPCVILLDLMMPVMDGWEFRDKQRRDGALASIPVVICTAAGDAPQKAAALGAAAFLQKPVDASELLDTVRRYC